MKRDLLNNTKVLEAITHRELAENAAAVQSDAIDRQGFEGAVGEVHFSGMAGGVTGGSILVTLYEGDLADTLSASTDIRTYTFDADDKSGVIRVPYTGVKRFFAVNVDNNLIGGGAGTNTVNVSATALLGYPRSAPVAQDLAVE